jgi:hypothetical protein
MVMPYLIENSEKNWQEFYRAAIAERDAGEAADLIAHAEEIIVSRTRTLFDQSLFHPSIGAAYKHGQERSALDAALYALSVLKQYSRPKVAA